MIPYTQIHTQHWSGRLGKIGEVVVNAEEIRQAIQLILLTPRGSDPFRAEFGSRIHDYVDWPVTRARPYLVRESIAAIRQWEPRVEVKSLQVLGFGERGDIAAHQLVVRADVVLASNGAVLPIIETILTANPGLQI